MHMGDKWLAYKEYRGVTVTYLLPIADTLSEPKE